MARVTYNSQALYVGPSGKNFINYLGGELINGYETPEDSETGDFKALDPENVHNLVSQLDRIQNFSYDISIPRTDLKQINTTKILDRPIVQYPQVNFSFDYLIADVSNESKMGFYVNFPQYQNQKNGKPFFEDMQEENNNGQSSDGGNFSYSILSGFFSEDIGVKKFYNQGELDPYYPSEPYRDKKNYYLAVRNDSLDIFQDVEIGPDTQAQNYNVICFGNCYMTSYSTSASVGSLPSASVQFVGDNVKFESSGIDFSSPSINLKDGKPLLDEYNKPLRVDLPKRKKENLLPALNPGDIVFTPHFIDENGDKIDSFTGMGASFEDIHLDSYSINMNIPRDTQENLGYKFPLDRRIESTAPVSLSIQGTVYKMGNSKDSLENLLKINQDYDFTISLKGPRCDENILLTSFENEQDREKHNLINKKEPLINYFFKSAKLDSFNYGVSVGENLKFSANFSTEIDPDDLSKGFFISGFLSNSKQEDNLIAENDSSSLSLNEAGDLLVQNNVPLI